MESIYRGPWGRKKKESETKKNAKEHLWRDYFAAFDKREIFGGGGKGFDENHAVDRKFLRRILTTIEMGKKIITHWDGVSLAIAIPINRRHNLKKKKLWEGGSLGTTVPIILTAVSSANWKVLLKCVVNLLFFSSVY